MHLAVAGERSLCQAFFRKRKSIHSAHSHIGSGSSGSLRLLLVSNECLGGKNYGSNGSCVLESGTGYLGGIDDSCLHHIGIDLLCGIKAVADLLGAKDLITEPSNPAFSAI